MTHQEKSIYGVPERWIRSDDSENQAKLARVEEFIQKNQLVELGFLNVNPEQTVVTQ